MRLILFISSWLFLLSGQALSQGQDLGGFESWPEQVASVEPLATTMTDAGAPASTDAAQAQEPKNQVEKSLESAPLSPPAAANANTIILFGAGASWLVPVRLSDGATGHQMAPEFSVSWAPFGLVGEIGADLIIGEKNMIIFKPNLKCFFTKQAVFSAYLEASSSMLSSKEGTQWGGGAGFGMIFGLMDNLALEVRVSGSAYSLSEKSAMAFVEKTQVAEAPAGAEPASDKKSLVLFPSVSLRLMARF